MSTPPTVQIAIPTALRSFAGGAARVAVQGHTVAEALQRLTTDHAGLEKHLRGPDGKLRSFVNIYLGDEDIRFLPDKEGTALTEGAELIIVPSIAGGAA